MVALGQADSEGTDRTYGVHESDVFRSHVWSNELTEIWYFRDAVCQQPPMMVRAVRLDAQRRRGHEYLGDLTSFQQRLSDDFKAKLSNLQAVAARLLDDHHHGIPRRAA